MKSKNIFGSLVFLLAVVILPLGSWYYLDTGLEYRKNLQIEITDLTPFNKSTVFPQMKHKDGTDIDWLQLLENKATVIFNYNKNIQEKFDAFERQFRNSEKFQMICLSDTIEANSVGENFMVDKIPEELATAYLINSKLEIVNEYELDAHGLIKLIEHTAVVIPRKAEKDILLKTQHNE